MKHIPVLSMRLVREGRVAYEQRPVLTNPAQAYAVLQPQIADRDKEYLLVLFLDRQSHLTGIHTAAIGNAFSTECNPREILKAALLANATGILLAHNHPSGDPTPSEEDITCTKRVNAACKILDIELLDHIVVGHERYISLKQINAF